VWPTSVVHQEGGEEPPPLVLSQDPRLSFERVQNPMVDEPYDAHRRGGDEHADRE
jgi:hypothetical protein